VCGEEGVALKDNRTGVEEIGFREREVERRMNGVGVWVGGLLLAVAYRWRMWIAGEGGKGSVG
jgi:hypothetical protein